MGEYPIKEACLKFFTGKETFHTFLKYAVPVAITFMGATITYGIASSKYNSDQNTRLCIVENKLARLDSLILTRLDSIDAHTKLANK